MKFTCFCRPRSGVRSLILAGLVLAGISCAKSSDPETIVTPKPVVYTDPPQYNTPFVGVPDARDAVIYQVNIRAFSANRTFQAVIARLDSIKNLGVNVIYLMPIYPVGSLRSINSPYCVKDYKSVNPEFGTLTDLRTLIDGAHSRGMAVMLDWVANHTSWDHTWMTNKTWYVQNASGTILSPNTWTDVAQLNFANSEMRRAMINAMKYWVLAANCDGFRCDYADGPPADFWKQAIDTLRHVSTHKLLMLAEGTRSDHFASGFNYIFGFRFYDQLKNVFINKASAATLETMNSFEYNTAGETNRVVRYITNHDVNSSDGTPLDLFGGKTGSMAAFVAAAYLQSTPMIYSGQEVATPNQLTFPFTSTTIDWSINPAVTAEYKRVIALFNSSEALRRGRLTTYSSSDICAFTKTLNTETVLVLANTRNNPVNFTIPAALSNSNWRLAFADATISLGSQLTLSSYSYLVLIKK